MCAPGPARVDSGDGREGGCPRWRVPAVHTPHTQQCHEAFRLFERPRGGQKLWVFQEAKPAFRLGLAFIAGSQLLRG